MSIAEYIMFYGAVFQHKMTWGSDQKNHLEYLGLGLKKAPFMDLEPRF